MQDLIRRMPGVLSTRVGYTGGDVPNATYRNHGDHAEAIEILFDPAKTELPGTAGVFLPDPRSVDPQPPGERHRPQLPFGDLLYRRRPEARRARHDRRRRRLRPVAGQGGDGGRAGGSVLAGRARASGLSRALSERLHLPLPAARLGAAEARRRGIGGAHTAIGWRRSGTARLAPCRARSSTAPRSGQGPAPPAALRFRAPTWAQRPGAQA